MPINILFVAGSFPPDRCGVGDYTRRLAIAVSDVADARVSVLTTGTLPVASDDGGVSVLRSMPDWSLRRAGALFRQLRRLRPAIVHVQYPTQGYGTGGLPWLVPLLAALCGARVVQTWHEGFNRRDIAKFLLMLVVPGAIVVVRKAYLRQVRRPFGLLARWRRPSYINSASTLPRANLSPAEALALRDRYRAVDRRLVVFFGFLHPLKRVELLFEIADPATDTVLIVGETGDQRDYVAGLEALSRADRWRGRAEVIGFATPRDAATLLATADAVVLPLQMGGGEWNTSILAAVMQGTFVLATSAIEYGYDANANICYCRIDDVDEMRRALRTYAGVRRTPDRRDDAFDWASIATRHVALYEALLPPARRTNDMARRCVE